MISLKDKIHQAVLSEPKSPYKAIRASALGGCPRVHFYRIKGLEATTPPNLGALMNFKMGYVWEDTVLPLLERVGAKVTTFRKEKWAVPELNLTGTPDYAVELDGENVIVDCKTVNSKWFWYQEGAFKRVNGATGISKNEYLLKDNESYEIQLGTYLLMAEHKGLKFDGAKLLFVNKDNSFIGWEVEVSLTKELREKILARIELLNKHLKANTVPQCTCEGWKVNYCDYGRPSTREQNKAGKWVSKECCGDHKTIKQWQEEALPQGESNANQG